MPGLTAFASPSPALRAGADARHRPPAGLDLSLFGSGPAGPAAHVASMAGRATGEGLPRLQPRPGLRSEPVQGDGHQPGTDVAFLVGVDRVRGAAAELL